MKRVYVSYYDHTHQTSEETFLEDAIKVRPQRPFIMEMMGWLVFEDDLILQVAQLQTRQDDEKEYEYGLNFTILKSTILDYKELK